jgi:hypothetical protein
MNAAMHKENYAAYEERKAILHNQQQIFREIQVLQDPNVQLSPIRERTYIPYSSWKMENDVDWSEMEALSKGKEIEEVSIDNEDESDDE